MDLLGRLSNPPETLENVTGQGVESTREAHEEPPKQAIWSPTASESDVQETPGRLSNPARATETPPSPEPPHQVQRRLTPTDVDDISASYVSGSSIDEMARSYGVNRTTIISISPTKGCPADEWSGR